MSKKKGNERNSIKKKSNEFNDPIKKESNESDTTKGNTTNTAPIFEWDDLNTEWEIEPIEWETEHEWDNQSNTHTHTREAKKLKFNESDKSDTPKKEN
ncbi:MAG: hypothetical protein WAU01_04495 [Saprospiraceae bacterium]